MTKNNHVEMGQLAVLFLSSLRATLLYTNIDTTSSEPCSSSICVEPRIRDDHFISSESLALIDDVLCTHALDIKPAVLKRDIDYLCDLLEEVLWIIGNLEVVDVPSTRLDKFRDSLKEIRNNLSCSTFTRYDSQVGFIIMLYALLEERDSFKHLAMGFTNATPIARHFIVANTLTRIMTCQVRLNWKP